MLSFILIIILAFATQSFLPWWTIAVVAFAIAWVRIKKGGKAFLIGFSAIFLLWLIKAIFSEYNADGALVEKTAEAFSLPQPWMLFVAAAIVGGLVGGLSAAAGSMIRSSFFRKRKI